jgi:hypothetical protein
VSRIPEKIKKFVIKNYPNKGAKYCADMCKLKESQVRYLAIKLKLKVTKNRKSFIAKNKIQKPYDQYNVNPLQFIDIKTSEVAYILGFLWADGNLGSNHSVNIEIISDDAVVIKNIFMSTGKWHIFYRNRKNYKPQTKFVCNSKLLCEHLINIGFNHKSKSPKKLLKLIPKKLHNYWFRGYFDGDGCWYSTKKNYIKQGVIASSYDQNWSFMTKLLKELGVKIYHINRDKRINKKGIENRSSKVRFCNIDGITKIGSYIYGGKKFGLTRKYKKYLQIVAHR